MQSVGLGADFNYHARPILSDGACSSLLDFVYLISIKNNQEPRKPRVWTSFSDITEVGPHHPPTPYPEEKLFSRFSGTNTISPLCWGEAGQGSTLGLSGRRRKNRGPAPDPSSSWPA